MIIQAENVKKHYPAFSLDCSLELEAGQAIGIIGRNGAGKTTLFKLLMNLIDLDSGSITLFNKSHTKLSDKDRRKIGVAYSDSGFSKELTIMKISQILAGFYEDFDTTLFLQKCEQQRLPLDQQLKEFSTGMNAKLNLLIATSFKAELLILDEPTAGLDVMARNELLDELRDFMATSNNGLLISSHISSDLEGICDVIYLIDEGKIIFKEETDVILDFYGILKLDEQQYHKIDKEHIMKTTKAHWGYQCLTNQKQYYLENYPEFVIEKASLDSVLEIIIGDERK